MVYRRKVGGFRLASLLTLVDTKSTSNTNVTLLHFLAKVLWANHPNLYDFDQVPCSQSIRSSINSLALITMVQDLDRVHDAARLDIDVIRWSPNQSLSLES